MGEILLTWGVYLTQRVSSARARSDIQPRDGSSRRKRSTHSRVTE